MGYNQKLEDKIDHRYIERTDLRKNKQMGGVGWVIKGNMCFGIYDDLLVVRMDPDYIDSLLDKPDINLFGNKETESGPFISVTERIYRHPKALNKFLEHALKQTQVLPAKKRYQNSTY